MNSVAVAVEAILKRFRKPVPPIIAPPVCGVAHEDLGQCILDAGHPGTHHVFSDGKTFYSSLPWGHA